MTKTEWDTYIATLSFDRFYYLLELELFHLYDGTVITEQRILRSLQALDRIRELTSPVLSE